MSRFLLNLRDQRARNETQSLTFTSTAIFVSRSPSTLKSTWDSRGAVSHSMAGSMIGDSLFPEIYICSFIGREKVEYSSHLVAVP